MINVPSPFPFYDLNFGQTFSEGPILTSIDELDQNSIHPEQVFRVKGATVAYANYPLLQHDFPQLSNESMTKNIPLIRNASSIRKKVLIREEIDRWLLRNSAYISQNQKNQTSVNMKIPTTNESVIAFRPPAYGRALVFSLEENDRRLEDKWNGSSIGLNGLLDVKGTGVAPDKTPENKGHSNGLYNLGYAFVELLMQELLVRIFSHARASLYTLPVYGIVNLGFKNKSHFFKNSPSGLIIRRAHRRPPNPGGLYPYGSTGQRAQIAIEKILRKYGLTSVNEVTTLKFWVEDNLLKIKYGDQNIDFLNEDQMRNMERVSHIRETNRKLEFEGINIEHTREVNHHPLQATLIDFESYSAKKDFSNPMLSLVSDRLMRWGGSIWPNDPSYVQPDPKLQIPTELLSGKGRMWGYQWASNWTKVYNLCYGMAYDLFKGKLTRNMLLGTLSLYMDALTEHLTTETRENISS